MERQDSNQPLTKRILTSRKIHISDEQLLNLYYDFDGSWNEISKNCGLRPKLCKSRINSLLFPNRPWSKFEDELLHKKTQEYGHDWDEIVKTFPGRSIHELINRFNEVIIKRYPSRKVVFAWDNFNTLHCDDQMLAPAANAAFTLQFIPDLPNLSGTPEQSFTKACPFATF